MLRNNAPTDHVTLPVSVSRTAGALMLLAFFALLVGLPLLAAAVPDQTVKLVDSFYRAGSLVFGGGHVVLPLLQAEVVPPGWVTNDAFLAGYGAAQAVPGPLFTFAAYLGAAMGPQPNGWLGAAICLVPSSCPRSS
jgi:chromate transporter